ncbi:hypothetical protein JAAARDRAFT_433856 [Jaapia argillacea MUCL 33604]|uniref:Uncharacterized protein n=1 Tax=Jaapia argillacea MUCL 33604 TaxID=933084 RepID=A0A067PEM8_9AGAM|nr:hypothetical protein JAAARDRAFT_433856 [Jaapia argillacea MUCL 33604]
MRPQVADGRRGCGLSMTIPTLRVAGVSAPLRFQILICAHIPKPPQLWRDWQSSTPKTTERPQDHCHLFQTSRWQRVVQSSSHRSPSLSSHMHTHRPIPLRIPLSHDSGKPSYDSSLESWAQSPFFNFSDLRRPSFVDQCLLMNFKIGREEWSDWG